MKIENMGRDILIFADSLREKERSEKTINAYCYSVWQFQREQGNFTWQTLHAYKESLIRRYKPRTVNQRICGINTWLKFKESTLPPLKQVKVQQISYLENVISDADYERLKNALASDGLWVWFYLVHYMASTGMRVSEVRLITAEDVQRGWKDVLSKGGKDRRIFFPEDLRQRTLKWLNSIYLLHGPIFLNKRGAVITDSGIRSQLKVFAVRYGIPSEVMHPHSFRHHFAKTFLHNYPDISLLADLLGHTKIDTTRIYLRQTCSEQKDLINKIVTW